MYHQGFSDDTPNFIIDALEDGYHHPQQPMSTDTTDTVRYKPQNLEPNENGRGPLFENNTEEEDGNGANRKYTIRCY